MLDFLFNLFFGYILIVLGFFFAVMAYTHRKQTFFYIGMGFGLLACLSIFYEIEYYFFSIFEGNLLSIGFGLAWVLSIIFLVLSQLKKADAESKHVTEEYLNEIIYGEDEEWDPES